MAASLQSICPETVKKKRSYIGCHPLLIPERLHLKPMQQAGKKCRLNSGSCAFVLAIVFVRRTTPPWFQTSMTFHTGVSSPRRATNR